ncbi:unnamed protein product, partial [Clonostachys rhizophaga]
YAHNRNWSDIKLSGVGIATEESFTAICPEDCDRKHDDEDLVTTLCSANLNTLSISGLQPSEFTGCHPFRLLEPVDKSVSARPRASFLYLSLHTRVAIIKALPFIQRGPFLRLSAMIRANWLFIIISLPSTDVKHLREASCTFATIDLPEVFWVSPLGKGHGFYYVFEFLANHPKSWRAFYMMLRMLDLSVPALQNRRRV